MAWGIGVRKNDELLRSDPDAKPFVWGYTFVYALLWSSVSLALFVIGAFVLGEIRYRAEDFAILILATCAVSIWVSVYAIRRRRWALVTLTVLSASIWYWVINFFYLKNRWQELDPKEHVGEPGEIEDRQSEASWFSTFVERYNNFDIYQRLSMSGGAVWVVVSFLYFIAFDEFDTSRERSSAMFLMFVPPLLVFTLRTLYLREIKRVKDK